jgi:hypothetical protein
MFGAGLIKQQSKNMKTKIFYLSLFLIILFGCNYSSSNESSVHLINKSLYDISTGLLDVCGHKFEISFLRPNEKLNFVFMPHSDCQYFVKVKFSSGKTLEKGIGYVTGGLSYDDTLIVTDNDIIFGQRKVLSRKQ